MKASARAVGEAHAQASGRSPRESRILCARTPIRVCAIVETSQMEPAPPPPHPTPSGTAAMRLKTKNKKRQASRRNDDDTDKHAGELEGRNSPRINRKHEAEQTQN